MIKIALDGQYSWLEVLYVKILKQIVKMPDMVSWSRRNESCCRRSRWQCPLTRWYHSYRSRIELLWCRWSTDQPVTVDTASRSGERTMPCTGPVYWSPCSCSTGGNVRERRTGRLVYTRSTTVLDTTSNTSNGLIINLLGRVGNSIITLNWLAHMQAAQHVRL